MDNISNYKSYSREEMIKEFKLMTIDDLNYLLNRYGGPHNILIREKVFNYSVSSVLTKLLNDEIYYRSLEEILLSDN